MIWFKDGIVMGQSLLDFKQWLLAELERKLRWRDPDRKRHSTIYKIILCKKIDLALTGACLVALSIFKSKIYPDIIYIPSVLKQKSGNWKMATIRSSSQQLQASITALVFLLLISTFAINNFSNKNISKTFFIGNFAGVRGKYIKFQNLYNHLSRKLSRNCYSSYRWISIKLYPLNVFSLH